MTINQNKLSWDLTPFTVALWKMDWTEFIPDPFWAVLSPSEQERAKRFVQERDRHRFTITRGCLRILLGQYLKTEPTAIAFSYRPTGKPFLTGTSLQFNVSHSGELAYFIFTPEYPVGIDIEKIRSLPQASQLAKRFFSPSEFEAVAASPPHQQEYTFFQIWTRKEAYLKATGEGLSGLETLAKSSVSLEHPHPVISPHPEQKWQLYDLSFPSDYTGAIALFGSNPYQYKAFQVFSKKNSGWGVTPLTLSVILNSVDAP